MTPASKEWKKTLRRFGKSGLFSRKDRENESGGLCGRRGVVLLSIAVLAIWSQVLLSGLVYDSLNHARSNRALHDVYAEDKAEKEQAHEAEAAIKVADTEIHGVSVGSLADQTTTHERAAYHPAGKEFESYRPLLDHLKDQILSGGRTDGDWDKISNDVVIAIKTGQDVYEERLEWVNKTWLAGRKMPCLMYIAETSNTNYIHSMEEYSKELLKGVANVPEGGLFEKTFGGGWEGDKDKNLPGFALMYDMFPDKKHYLMVDDDTYVLLDNLATNLLERRLPQEDKKPVYIGRFFGVPKPTRGCFDRVLKESPPFAHGGSGILMNHASTALIRSRVAECISEFHTCWGGDIQTSLCWHRITNKNNRKLAMKGRKNIFGTIIFKALDLYAKPENIGEKDNPFLSDDLPVTLHKLKEPRQVFDIARFDRLLPGNRTLESLYYYLLDLKRQREQKV
ncbi:hypothetical protein NDN08_004353 [Rhodosorus marinus]|uniref:Hexosyltransferase n=1 Tax=Rhodosorus marinus TaxID=101924 RepID=A0AAV8UL09_9RHOD|nr:hypothetical protein NDN08_004353 [Rhodosorus marinus]